MNRRPGPVVGLALDSECDGTGLPATEGAGLDPAMRTLDNHPRPTPG